MLNISTSMLSRGYKSRVLNLFFKNYFLNKREKSYWFTHFFKSFFFSFFETKYPYVVQPVLKLTSVAQIGFKFLVILLPRPPEFWDYRYGPCSKLYMFKTNFERSYSESAS